MIEPMTLEYPGIDGFLGTRASLVLDLLVVAMVVIVVVQGWSIYEVKYRRRYNLHKWVQTAVGTVLLVAVVVFEIDIRIHGWEERSAGALNGKASRWAWNALYVHLWFAVSTVILWPVVIVRAWRRFPNPPAPSTHSAWHIRWAWLAAICIVATAVTGWGFYAVAFVW
jgi:hypothetical protein